MSILHSQSDDNSEQCAADQGVYPGQPASHECFNQHPKRICRELHPFAVKWVIGCSRHHGQLDANGVCHWCVREIAVGQIYWTKPYKAKWNYPGDRDA
jgi:hypothetical protein